MESGIRKMASYVDVFRTMTWTDTKILTSDYAFHDVKIIF